MNYLAIKIISTFSKHEFEELKKFVNSSYFNSSSSLIKFFNLMEKYFNANDSPKFKFPDHFSIKYISFELKISEQRVRRLFGDLANICERFLAQHRFDTFRYLHRITMIEELHQRNIVKSLKKKIKHIEADLNSETNYNSSDYLTRFTLERIKHERELFWKIVDNKSDIDNKMQIEIDLIKNLLIYLLVHCSETFINVVDYSQKLGVSYSNIPFVKFFKTYKSASSKLVDQADISSLQRSVLRIYELMEEMQQKKNLFSNFSEYKEILCKIAQDLDIDEKYNLFSGYHFLFPEVAEHDNEDERLRYQQLELDFYDEYFKNAAYKNSGQDYMTLSGFKYFFTRGDDTEVASKFLWSDNLLKNHIRAIRPEYRKNIVALRNAFVYMKRDGNWEMAITELSKIKLSEVPELSIRRDIDYFYIRLFYELKNYDAVVTHCARLKHLLMKKNIHNIDQEIFLMFIQYISELCTIVNRENYENIEYLKSNILKSKAFPSKKWIVEKINEIQKAHKLK